MNDASNLSDAAGDAGDARSNRTYDELIREYIRAARERLEATKRASPPTTTTTTPAPTNRTVPRPHPAFTSAERSSTRPHVPQPSLNWPLRASGINLPSNDALEDSVQASSTSSQVNAINFSDRPARILALAVPELAPRSSSLPQQTQFSVAPAPTQVALQSLPDEDTTRHSFLDRAPSHTDTHGQDDDRHNPFADRELLREASIGRSHKATLTKIKPRTSQDQELSRDDLLDNDEGGFTVPDAHLKPRSSFRYSLMPSPAASTPVRTPSRIIEEYAIPNTIQATPAKSSSSKESNDYDPHTESSPPSQPLALRSAFNARPDTATSFGSSAASFRFGSIPTSQRQSALSERVGSRKPPPLHLDAVKTAEARGSLTSLPELIQRALKLASNLEKGRTASRMGTDWLGSSTQLPGDPDDRSRQDSPLPPSDSGNGRNSPFPRSAGLQSRLRNSFMPSLGDQNVHNEKSTANRQQKRRRCLGMPLWLFVLVLVVIFMLIAAAILVPIFLVVIPQRHRATSGCQNGAQIIDTASGAQQCICVNGYTGSSCERIDNTGCLTTNTTSATNATVGVGVASVMSNADSTYGIQLNSDTVLGLLSSADLTCSAETYLITFSGLSSRSLHDGSQALSKHCSVSGLLPHSTLQSVETTPPPLYANLRPRTQSNAATTEGIVFMTSSAASTTITPTSTTSSASLSSIVTATPSTSSTANSSSTFNPNSEQTLGLARTAVLFILQITAQVSDAQTAQQQLASYFTNTSSANAMNLTLVDTWSINLVKGTISDGKGATYGGG